MNRTGTIVGIIVGVLTIVGALFTADSYYAHAEDMNALEMELALTNTRLERKILEDRYYGTMARIWKIQDRIEAKGPNPALENELRELRHYASRVKHDLDSTMSVSANAPHTK